MTNPVPRQLAIMRAPLRPPLPLRLMRLVERMDRLAIDGGGAVSPEGPESADAVPKSEGSR